MFKHVQLLRLRRLCSTHLENLKRTEKRERKLEKDVFIIGCGRDGLKDVSGR